MNRTRALDQGFVVPIAAVVSLTIGLLLMGGLEFVRLQNQDITIIRARAEAQPALESAMTLTGLLLRVSRREAAGAAPDAVVGRGLLGLKMNKIYFDATPFEIRILDRQLRVAVQDEAGIAPINALSSQEVSRYLAREGVSQEVARRFAAQAMDFRDFDHERTVDGAETDDYARNGLSPPKNRAFNFVGEFSNLLNAAEFQTEISRALLNSFGSDRSGLININATPAASLISVFGFTEASAAQFVQDRRQRSVAPTAMSNYYRSFDALHASRIATGASNRFRVEIIDIESQARLRRTIELEPTTIDLSGALPSGRTSHASSDELRVSIDRETIDLR